MSDVALRVEGLSKRYRLGLQENSAGGMYRYKSLRDVFGNLARRPWKALTSGRRPMTEENSFWALKDIDIEVKRGEVVGIIGRNGAGKSTLLKILSRITKPTTGRIDLYGRVGSLLEVGTGFHPELSGRENIYLNGAILGMTRAEVTRKFDEIVAFSEIDKFLDTAVKQYSSGMYMRLAFAVAAHLEPDILVVDEVLAVGDAMFQQKCIGKMGAIASQGRTVLLVTHNFGIVRSLCQNVLVLDQGEAVFRGGAAAGIQHAMSPKQSTEVRRIKLSGSLSNCLSVGSIQVNGVDCEQEVHVDPNEPIRIRISYQLKESLAYRFTLGLFRDGFRLASLFDAQSFTDAAAGEHVSTFEIKPHQIRPGRLHLAVGAYSGSKFGDHAWAEDVGQFNINEVWTAQNEERALGLVNLDYRAGRE